MFLNIILLSNRVVVDMHPSEFPQQKYNYFFDPSSSTAPTHQQHTSTSYQAVEAVAVVYHSIHTE